MGLALHGRCPHRTVVPQHQGAGRPSLIGWPASGFTPLDDSTELKGEPDRMVRVGARIFAERVARAVRQGGVTTNFPQPE